MALPACPELDSALARAAARIRGRRAAAGALLALGLSGVVAAGLEMIRTVRAATGDTPFGHAFAFGAGAAVLVGGAALAATARWTRVDEERIARDLDRRLGLADTAATVLALVRGRIASPLAAHVVAAASPALASAAPRIDVAYALERPARKAARTLWAWALLTWLAALVLLVADLLHWFDFGFGLLGRHAGRDTGISAQTDPSVDRRVPNAQGGAQGGDEERPDAPGGAPPADAPDGPDRPAPPAPADRRGPDVRAKVKPSRETFRATDPVLVVVSATPTREIPSERTLTVSLDVDGHEAPTGTELRLGPGAPLGSGGILDLRRVPGLASRVGPGEHVVRAKLVERDGTEHVSDPARFRVDAEDGAGGGAAPRPQPAPGAPPPSAPPPPAPAAADRPSPKPADAAPPPAPQVPLGFDPKVVVPLFGEGEEVTKRGRTVVLEPGGGTGSAPARQVPLEEALPDAAARAERHVDRGGVRPDDRDLVRRYFEALARSLR